MKKVLLALAAAGMAAAPLSSAHADVPISPDPTDLVTPIVSLAPLTAHPVGYAKDAAMPVATQVGIAGKGNDSVQISDGTIFSDSGWYFDGTNTVRKMYVENQAGYYWTNFVGSTGAYALFTFVDNNNGISKKVNSALRHSFWSNSSVPLHSQNILGGYRNDAILYDDVRASKVSSTGWQLNNTNRMRTTAPAGEFYFRDGDESTIMDVTYTDNGTTGSYGARSYSVPMPGTFTY